VKEIRELPYRPQVEEFGHMEDSPSILQELMRNAWDENPAERPTFEDADKVMKIVNNGRCVMIGLS
jgi:hypothetical protein